MRSLLEAVQRDLEDRLRSLRIKPTRLRTWIHVWLGILLAVFLAVWLVTDGVVLAASVALFLAAGPWYLIRRMAATPPREDRRSIG